MAIGDDMLAWGLGWLAGQLVDNASEQITYFRGQLSATIQATLAKQILRVTDGLGNTKVERPDMDFLFLAVDLDFQDGNGPVEPVQGDEIHLIVGARTDVKRFRVMPLGGDPSWRYSDPFQGMIRVHTKFVGIL